METIQVVYHALWALLRKERLWLRKVAEDLNLI